MGEKQAWAARRADDVRRLLMLEPRGHVDMFGAVFTEATQPGSDAGLLFMGHDGFHTMSGHGVIAATTIGLERGLLVPRDYDRIVLDTVAGRVRVSVRRGGSQASTRVVGVSYANVPALPISYSLQTIMEEFSMEPAVYTKGKLTFVAPMSGQIPMRFPPPIGAQRPMHTIHSEVATLPTSFVKKGLREVSFKIAFDPAFLEKIRFLRDLGLASAEPIYVGETKVSPIQVLNKVAMLQKPARRIGKLKQYEIVRTILKGTKGRQKVTVVLDCHTAGLPKWRLGSDVNTGCPPAVVARMIAGGQVKGTGVVPPEQIVPPRLFFEHLKLRGFQLRISRKSGWGMKT
jgi:hypothetical protein